MNITLRSVYYFMISFFCSVGCAMEKNAFDRYLDTKDEKSVILSDGRRALITGAEGSSVCIVDNLDQEVLKIDNKIFFKKKELRPVSYFIFVGAIIDPETSRELLVTASCCPRVDFWYPNDGEHLFRAYFNTGYCIQDVVITGNYVIFCTAQAIYFYDVATKCSKQIFELQQIENRIYKIVLNEDDNCAEFYTDNNCLIAQFALDDLK